MRRPNPYRELKRELAKVIAGAPPNLKRLERLRKRALEPVEERGGRRRRVLTYSQFCVLWEMSMLALARIQQAKARSSNAKP